MSYLLKGVIDTNENDQKIVKYLGKNYIIDNPNDFELINDSEIEFKLEKKIFSDTIDIVAKVFNPVSKTWDDIFKDFIKKESNFTISRFQDFLKSNYQTPELLNK